MHFTIRDMRDDDWERVSQIYEQALQEGISTFAMVCPTFDEWDKAHLKDCRYVMLADDTVIGWCAVSPTSSDDSRFVLHLNSSTTSASDAYIVFEPNYRNTENNVPAFQGAVRGPCEIT